MLLRFLFGVLLALQSHAAHADLILLLSDNKPSVLGVAQALRSAAGGRIETINLGGDRGTATEKVAAIQAMPIHHVVAIGLLAAQVARQNLASKIVVFCQVLNYEDFDLTTSWMKGVSAIPSMHKPFQVWKAITPSLKRIGVITSRQMREVVEEAAAEAAGLGFELIHLEVGSDREVMSALRRANTIQGLWLAPDSRVLSSAVILDMLSHATRQNIQVLGFSPALLKEGALLSTTPDNAEIARQVLLRLRLAGNGTAILGEPVLALISANVTINGDLAQRLGLTLPEKIKAIAHVD